MTVRRSLLLLVFTAPLVLLVVVFGGTETPYAIAFEEDLTVFAGAEGIYETDVVEAPLTMVGFSWSGNGPERVWYRVSRDGRWSDWAEIVIDTDHAPDPGTEEAARQRFATEPVYVGRSDGVQFRLAGPPPRQAKAALVDTTNRTRPLLERLLSHFHSARADAAPAQPSIRPRSDWDPANTCVPRVEPEEIQVTHAIVHHTGITRSYSQAEVPSILLGYCLYHRNSRGWDDVAYNFFIDRFGRAWEGRAGGIDRGIRGGHTAGFSGYSTGIAFIGNYNSNAPTWQQNATLVELLAWKLSIHNLDPQGSTTVISRGSFKWDEGVPVTLKTIMGHRDAQTTSCPGTFCYNLLPTYRANVAAQWAPLPADYYTGVVVGDVTGDGIEDGIVHRPSDGAWLVTNGSSGSASVWITGTGWNESGSGDLDGDGRDEVVGLAGTAITVLDPSGLDPSGSSFTSSQVATLPSGSWSKPLVGDFDGDEMDEVAFVRSDGATYVLSGSATSWGSLPGNGFLLVGDFNGDGRDDLAKFQTNGRADVAISSGSAFDTTTWRDHSPDSGWDHAVAADFEGDGDTDIAAYHGPTDTWHSLRSIGSSFVASGTVELPTLDHISLAFAYDYGNDGKEEIAALDALFAEWHLGDFSGRRPFFGRIEDAPFRTTVSRNGIPAAGSSYLTFFGQEFSWIRADVAWGASGDTDATDLISGSNRYDTAATVVDEAFSAADTVFIVTGEKYPDALAAGAAAGIGKSPVLLTQRTGLPSGVRSQLSRLAPAEIVVVGGSAAVAENVFSALGSYAGLVRRIGGIDRYETAAMMSKEFFPAGSSTVFVATGDNYPDAIAGVQGAAREGAPLLLVENNALPATTAAELVRLGPSSIVVLGGPVAISNGVVSQLQGYAPNITRRYGDDRYGTAAAVSAAAYPSGTEVAYLALGTGFADAVGASPAAAKVHGALLLAMPDHVPGATINELKRLRPNRIILVGGGFTKDVYKDLAGIGIGAVSQRLQDLPR